MQFKSGDAVQLKTGGPQMMVEHEVADLLLCSWLSPRGRMCRETYSARQLEAAESAELVGVTAMKRLAARWHVAATF